MPQKYGDLANEVVKVVKPCKVCDDPAPRFSWTDYHGEGYCLQCGTAYQLMRGGLPEGTEYPYCNINDEWIPILRKYWVETHMSNGSGTFMGFGDYPDQGRGRQRFNEWRDAHKDELPKQSEPQEDTQP